MGELKLRDYFVALLLFAASFTALGVAQTNQGIVRDEATYFQAAEDYWGWLSGFGESIVSGNLKQSLNQKSITRHFSNNNEHPVLCKILFGVSWRLFHQGEGPRDVSSAPGKGLNLNRLSNISAFRLPGWLFAGLAVAFLYLFGARIESRTAGLAAGFLYLTIPRVFFHGQLACFDSPIATMWLMVVYAYFRSLTQAKWGVYAGLIFGLALATKHNAWFIPFLLLLHYLMVVWPDVSLRPLHLPRLPLVFLSMAILGPLVFYAHWPWLWFDTVHHLKDYFNFHLHHVHYNIEYLGKNWGPPPHPISYPFVMTLFTVPTVTLGLALVGLWLYARPPLFAAFSRFMDVPRPAKGGCPPVDDRFRYPARRSWLRPGKGLDPKVGRLLFINALFPICLIAYPSTPIFGGTKHWLPAYPFVALLAGVALSRLTASLQTRLGFSRVIPLLLALAVALPGALNIAFTHPFGLSQYNALAGGPAGGADKGLNRQFWGYASLQMLPWLNQHVEDNGRVYFHDTNYDSYRMYIREKLLRPDIVDTGLELPGIASSTWALVIHELHFNKYDYWIWESYGTAAPVKVIDLDGVPVLSLYKRPPK